MLQKRFPLLGRGQYVGMRVVVDPPVYKQTKKYWHIIIPASMLSEKK